MPSSSAEAPQPARPGLRLAILGGVIALLAGVAITVLIVRDGSGADPSPMDRTDVSTAGVAMIGAPAPRFEGPALAGSGDAGFAPGRPTVITFWASWCAPCRKEFPLLVRAQADDPGLDVLGVVYKDIPADARTFVSEQGATWPNVVDRGEVARAYGVRAIPQTFFIDRNGIIQGRVYGFTSAGELEEQLDRIR